MLLLFIYSGQQEISTGLSSSIKRRSQMLSISDEAVREKWDF